MKRRRPQMTFLIVGKALPPGYVPQSFELPEAIVPRVGERVVAPGGTILKVIDVTYDFLNNPVVIRVKLG